MRGAAVRGALAPGAAAALCFAALFLSAGSSQSRLFWIGAAAVVLAAVGWAVRPPALPRPALIFFAAFTAFVVWQAASIAWSIEPARSWDYANRSLVYLAFAAAGAALLGGIAPRRLVEAAAALLGALFVWALAAKVIPALYDDYGRLARLRYPLGYWNELALLAAAAVPIGLWLARRLRLGAGVLLYTALVVVVLTYSRVGIVLSVLAAIAFLVLDERRLESFGVLSVAWIVGAAAAGVGLLLPGVADDGQAHSVRVHDGLLFGLALVAGAVIVVLALRFVVTRAVDVRVVRAAAVVLVALVLAALTASVVRAGGPGPWLSERWHEFSNPVNAQVANTPGRVVSTSSSNRWRWWQEAWNAFTDHPAQGTGAGTFGLTDRIERNSPLAVIEPHSTPLQFLTELGLIGFLLYGAIVVAIVRRTLIPLGLAIAVCVLHSFVDIDWDYVAVQGPLFLLIGALLAGPPVVRRGWLPGVAAGLCALAAIYSLASPWLSDERYNAALDSFTNRVGAIDDAKAAHSFNPLAVEPLWLLGALTGQKHYYEQARDLEPKNPDAWFELGSFELHVLHQPRGAYRDLNHAYTLDNFLFAKGSPPGRDLDRARCEIDPATCPK
ncbi:MAG: O-antigen ligase family protein [Gaiellaceae bacterium]